VSKIPPVDLTRQYKSISESLDTAVLEILRSGRYIGGETVTNFENKFAHYTGVSHCIACNSGTDALYLALKALNISPGDEVITSPFTFIATAEAITLAGAKPIFVDIDLQTFNLDINAVEKAITPATKAILPVHLFGQPVNMSALMAIADAHDLYVVEDCAQATGATWQGSKVGSIGHIGCFSFFPTKNLGACGDGGAVTTNDPGLAATIKMLREHGSKTRYLHEEIGVNSRLDALQAAILSVKLPYLDRWNGERQAAAALYGRLLQALSWVVLPQALEGGEHVWNQYTILVDDRTPTDSQSTRDRVREELQKMDVLSMVYYPIPLHLQPVYQSLAYLKGQLPQAEKASRQVLSLPMFPGITGEEQEQVAYSLKDCP
jgi:dTDP-4-amino-4,6-dideoxygalactose transaminase